MEEGSLCLKCAATQVTNTWIKAKNKVTFSLYFSSGKGLVTCVHHCALYSVKADNQHIMVVVKTTLFRFSCI